MAHPMVESGDWLSSVEARRRRMWECDDLLLDAHIHQDFSDFVVAFVQRHSQ
jgi:hypothetical protein